MVGITLFLVGCSGTVKDKKVETIAPVDTGFVLSAPGNYDSIDTAILVDKNTEEKTVKLLNLETGKRYTLIYDGASYLYNKFDEAIALTQIEVGDIVDVTFMRERKRLNTMKESSECFSYDSISNHTIDVENRTVTVGTEYYSISDDVVVLLKGAEISLSEINACDKIKISGFNHVISSIQIKQGHGYLKLVNDSFFIGGWIEVGQTLIQPIKENMRLVVPEGTYRVLITSGTSGGEKEVTIESGREILLDISDLEIMETKTGGIIFSITPMSATVIIDGEVVDSSKIVNMDYGIHQLTISEPGYTSITQYLKVGAQLASISVVLDPEKDTESLVEGDGETGTQASTTGTPITSTTNSTANDVGTVTTTYTVMIEAPIGAEVYVDGTYVGIAPTNFPKVAGYHVITLRKTGYEARNYTMEVDKEQKSVTYSFSELVAVQ